jgi:hypothetical protein
MPEAIRFIEQLVEAAGRTEAAARCMFAALGPEAEAAWEQFDREAWRYRGGPAARPLPGGCRARGGGDRRKTERDVMTDEPELDEQDELDDDDPTRCPACGERIGNPNRRRRHLAGLDGSRPLCARTDLEAVAEQERNSLSGYGTPGLYQQRR